VNATAEFQSLRALSAKLGADPLLVQAAGGNTSIKQDGVMWIKASGTWLMDALNKDIFVPLDLAALIKALHDNSPDCENCLPFVRQGLNALGLRPSIETSVHGRMPQRVVLHVHCVNTIAWAIREDAEQQLSQRLRDFNWSYIPYARPGLQLSQSIAGHLKPRSDVMVLENHGLAVAAETIESSKISNALCETAFGRTMQRCKPCAPILTISQFPIRWHTRQLLIHWRCNWAVQKSTIQTTSFFSARTFQQTSTATPLP
jgi:rhamnose utilization protein RhaD (predicted bifunctional aldolase and dehydrogenase)